MGNTKCCGKNRPISKTDYIGKELANAVLTSNISLIQRILTYLSTTEFTINSKLIIASSFFLAPLTYAFLIGNRKVFQYLHKNGACLFELTSTLEYIGIDPMYYICEQGHSEILNYYLPLYLENYSSDCEQNITLDLESQAPTKKSKKNLTPVQIACEKGNMQIIMALFKYFKDKPTPYIFDIEYPSEKNGENCALIACRKGNYPMIKFLHRFCNADFLKKNMYQENALIICTSYFKVSKKKEFIFCINYLLEQVNIDVTYMYEDLLLLAENKELIAIYEKKLKSFGIFTSKEEIEETQRLYRNLSVEEYEESLDLNSLKIEQRKSELLNEIVAMSRAASSIDIKQYSFLSQGTIEALNLD